MLNLLSLPEIDFGKSFLWGSSTSAHQVEGDDIYSVNYDNEKRLNFEPSGKACDFWHLYPQDIATMKQLGLQAFRMSIGWCRLEPEEGRFDEESLKVYLDMFTKLKENGIKIFLTFIHGGEPLWFDKKGAFKVEKNLDDFMRYAEWVVPKIAPYIDFWLITNEINLMGNSDMKRNCLILQARMASLIHTYSSGPVSLAHGLQCFVPDDPNSEADCVLCQYRNYMENNYFFHACRTGEIILPRTDMIYLPELKNSMDFWGLNYYTRAYCSAKGKNSRVDFPLFERLRMTDMEKFYIEGFYPDGLRNWLMGLKDKPIYITENGCSCDDDRWRLFKLAGDLTAIREAMDRGADVRGYLHWSFMDNYEWSSYKPHFGMIHVDFKTFKRTLKPTAKFMQELIANGGKFDGSMLRKYLPEFPQMKLY